MIFKGKVRLHFLHLLITCCQVRVDIDWWISLLHQTEPVKHQDKESLKIVGRICSININAELRAHVERGKCDERIEETKITTHQIYPLKVSSSSMTIHTAATGPLCSISDHMVTTVGSSSSSDIIP